MIHNGIEVIVSRWLRGPSQWMMIDRNRAVFSSEALRLEVLLLVFAGGWPVRDCAAAEEDG